MVEREGYKVEILDCNAENIDWGSLTSEVEKRKPDVVGVSAITPFFYTALKTAEVVKKVDREIKTVLGGSHATFMGREILKKHSEIDLIVKGEGELIFSKLIKALEKGTSLSNVKGLIFRLNGKIYETPDPSLLLNLDELPMPAYHLLPMKKYFFPVLGKFSVVLSSRGCPFSCFFCSEWKFWHRKWRKRDPSKVVDEIELLTQKYGRESIWFGDDCFNVDKQHMEKICSEIEERGLDVNWYYQGRADFVVKYRDLLPKMRRAGNLMVQIGVEAATDNELSVLRKNLKIETVKKAVKLLKQNNIICQGLMIIGTWRDKYETIMEKVNFMKKLGVDFPIYTVLTPFPGSDLFDEAKNKNLIEVTDYSKYDMAHALMPTKYLTRKQVMRLYSLCYEETYLNLHFLLEGLFSRNEWKRRIWRHMLKYMFKRYVHFLQIFPVF